MYGRLRLSTVVRRQRWEHRRLLTQPTRKELKGKEPCQSTRVKDPTSESHLNWKERSEAPKWMTKMAPTKGGKISDIKPYEAAAILAGASVFFYVWVVEPPKRGDFTRTF